MVRSNHTLECAVIAGLLSVACGLRAQDAPVSPQALAAIWDAEHVSPPLAPLVRHADVEAWLGKVRAATPDLFSLEEIGRSVEGRSINHLWFGRGDVHVLLWSQMHGDEPTATAALFDVFEYVRRRRGEPHVRRLLDRLTIHVVPMLNPDGAERFQRRNAQGIDVNRDALLLQTPEGRALKALRDRLNARIGFNLHNQNWRTSAGRPPKPAAISLLAVAYDEARSENEGRILTKKTCAVIRDALEPFAPGQIARYDDEFEVRAFGDKVTKWGTPVVLIDTGPWAAHEPDPPLVRLNFVAILAALDALATGRVHQADPRRYESLPLNESRLFAVIVKNATIVPGTGVAPFLGDVGIVTTRAVRSDGASRYVELTSRIEDLGDLRVYGAMAPIDATGLTVAPAFDAKARVGDRVKLPEWKGWKGDAIAIGEPSNLFLMRPADGGAYRIEQILSSRREMR